MEGSKEAGKKDQLDGNDMIEPSYMEERRKCQKSQGNLNIEENEDSKKYSDNSLSSDGIEPMDDKEFKKADFR